MKKNLISISLLVCLSVFSAMSGQAQTISDVVKVIVVNGGVYEFSPPYQDYVTVRVFDRYKRNMDFLDTIYTQSAQDLLLDSFNLYVAATDSIVKYDVKNELKRVAANAFGAPSTVKMALGSSYLFVGNWYGSSDNNLRVFNRNTLEFIDSIPEVTMGAKDMIVVGDTLYVQQNYTNASYTDSAGYFAVISLNPLKFVREIHFNNNDADLGRLVKKDNIIYAFNSASNTVTKYNVTTGASSTDTLPGMIQTGVYGQQLSMYKDTIYFAYENGIGAYHVPSGTVGSNVYLQLKNVVAFVYDEIHQWFFATRTDFGSFSEGECLELNGVVADTFPTAASPELLALMYSQEVGVEELTRKEEFTMFPNPAASQTTVVPFSNDLYDLQLFTITGKQLLNVTGLRNRYTVDMSEYPAGLYLVKLNSPGGAVTQRLIKK